MASLTEPSIRPAAIIGITASTILTGVIAYAFYFDYKRRHDLEFRKALKRDSKRSQKQAKLEAEASGRARRDEIRALVEQVNNENLPTDAEGHEQFFMEEVSKGEQLLQDESKGMDAALCFFRALKVYPTPEELINIYDKTVPKVCLSSVLHLDDSSANNINSTFLISSPR
jgi:import receptor subunit TOM20